jgi:hypothetical protein
MGQDRAMQAISRIEQALARLEQSASRRPPAPVDDSELLALRQSHRMLRGKVEHAIGEIDRLLAAGDERV